MASHRDAHAGALRAGLEVRVGDRAEAAIASLTQEGLVEDPEAVARQALLHRRGAPRVAGPCGHRGAVRPLPAAVPDHDGPAAAGLEEVVEVAAHLGAFAGGVEAGGSL